MKLIFGSLLFLLWTFGMWQFWKITINEKHCPWCDSWMLALEEYRCGCARWSCEQCGLEFYSSPCCGGMGKPTKGALWGEGVAGRVDSTGRAGGESHSPSATPTEGWWVS